MSEIEKAIEIQERAMKQGGTFGFVREFEESAQLSIEALQEKQEREKGCEYCRERKPILDELGNLQIDDIDSSLWFTCQVDADDIYEEHTDINYCPMCGRKIGENDDELKVCPFCGGEAEFKAMIANGGHPEDDIGYVKCKDCFAETGYNQLRADAIKHWNERTQPENKPLSLEELRQMDGEPVWCIGQTRYGTDFDGWKVVSQNNLTPDVIRFTDRTDWASDSYGKKLLAYARKPEQEEK